MSAVAPQTLVVATREQMIAEAKHLVDAARDQAIVVRIIGGFATRLHCRSLDFCERDHSDLDLIAHRRDVRGLTGLFEQLGYQENRHVREATQGRQLQFTRPCRHGEEWSRYRPHDEDHLDVFLDTFKMEHAIDLGGRLDLDDYTIAPTDVLLMKLQMARLEEKDERDIFTLLEDLPLDGSPAPVPTGDEPSASRGSATIDVGYIARLCARDWGLYHDVETNLALLQDRIGTFGVEPQIEDRVRASLSKLDEAIRIAPKSRRWQLRARFGTRLRWRDLVEEQG